MTATMGDGMLPNFLIIGAMKAGTTTLYEDLNNVPGVYLPPEKEPNDLAYDWVESQAGLAAYSKKFSNAPMDSIVGEASTSYAKLPTFQHVPERALRILGPELKIVYMTRDPISRIISHYHHLWGLGIETRPMREAVLSDETYVAYSDYERQLAPWRDLFPPNQILVISFEEFINDRRRVLSEVCTFLGVDFSGITNNSHRNASKGKRVVLPGSFWSSVAHSKFYLYAIKPMVPVYLRDKIKNALLPKAKDMSEVLDCETRAVLLERLNIR